MIRDWFQNFFQKHPELFEILGLFLFFALLSLLFSSSGGGRDDWSHEYQQMQLEESYNI